MKGENVTFVSELSKTNTLLSLTTVVMCGYQSLCPSLYAQVDFGLHRLLPPLNASHQLDEDSPMMAHEVLLPSLQLLLDAPQDGMKRLVGGAGYEPCLSVWGQMGGGGGGVLQQHNLCQHPFKFQYKSNNVICTIHFQITITHEL